MKRIIFTTVSLLMVAVVVAQDCDKTLSGQVIDFHNGQPLKGAKITFNSKTIVTDSQGTYTIDNLCAISYAFTVSHEDCNSQVFTIDISKIKTKDFYLEHHLDELDEVTVDGNKTKKTTSSQEESIDKDIIERYSSGSLGDALKEITGVSSLNTGSNIVKPVIQGLNGSRVLIMNNGVRMQDMEWGDEHAPNVDINAAGKITVIKGASALKYGGDAIGGIILIEPNKAPVKDSLFGKTLATANTNGRGGSLTSELVKSYESGLFFKVQGSLKRLGDVEAPDYVLSNTGTFERGVSVNFGVNKFTSGFDVYYSFYKNELGVLAASHIGNADDLITAINSAQPNIIRDFTYEINNPKQEVTHHLGRLRYFKRFEKLGKWTTQYDFQHNQRFEFDIRRTDELSKKPSLDLELTTHTITSDFEFDAKSDYTFTAGLLARSQENFAPPTGARRLIPNYDKYDAGAFVIAEYDLNQNVTLDAAIRYDFTQINAKKFYLNSRWELEGYEQDFSDIVIERGVSGSQLLVNPVFDYHNISATAGLQYLFKDQYEFRFNYALSQRAPNPSELFSDGLHHSAARIEIGDLRIDQETSHKIAMSIQKDGPKWGWELAPYVNFIQNFILLEPVGAQSTIRGSFPVWEYRQTDARLLGFDAKLYANWHSNWRTDHKFSLVKGIETEDKQALINMPPPNVSNKITFAKKDWFDFTASLESQYHFRQNEYPPNFDVFSPNEGEDVELRINTPTAAYNLLNLDTSMAFQIGKKNTLNIGVTVNNLANKTYRNYLNRQRYFADDLGRNFLFRISVNY